MKCEVFVKALQKAEYSDFCMFAKLETQFILHIRYISNKLHQNQIFIFAKYLFWLEFQSNIRLWLQYAGP